MRVLIIGNSHAALLRPYIESFQSKYSLTIEFLCAYGIFLKDILEIKESTITVKDLSVIDKTVFAPPQMSKDGYIQLHDYDCIVVFGLQLLSKARGDDWMEILDASNKEYSDAVWTALAVDYVKASYHFSLLEQLRIGKTHKILSIPSPFPNILKPLTYQTSNININRIEQFLMIVKQQIEILGVEFCELPVELVDYSRFLVKACFRKLDGDALDYSHLNEDGCHVLWNMMIAKFNSESQ